MECSTSWYISTQSSSKPRWLLGSPGAQCVNVTSWWSDHENKPEKPRSFRPIHTSLVAVLRDKEEFNTNTHSQVTTLDTRGWKTIMWWRSSRHRLVTEPRAETRTQVVLCTALTYDSAAHKAIVPHNISFLSVLLSLGRYISHKFLLILNQIQMK